VIPLSEQQRRELGLTAEDRLGEVESARAPESRLGHGLAGGDPEASIPLVDLLTRGLRKAVPLFLPVMTPMLGAVEGLQVSFDAAYPGIAVVSAPEMDLKVAATAHRLSDTELAVDARQSPGWVRLRHQGVDLLLAFTRGQVEVYPVRSGPPDLQRLAAWRGPLDDALAKLESPDVRAWCTGWPVESWLVDEAAKCAAAPAPAARFAAAGLVGRLWVAGRTGASREVAARLARAEPSPSDRAAAWVASHPAPVLDQLARAASHEIAALEEALDAVASALAERHAWAGDLAASWLRRRDELACTAWTLAGTEAERVLAPQLRALDRLAATRHTMWSSLPAIRGDRRLRAVSWIEPEAWWGSLAVVEG